MHACGLLQPATDRVLHVGLGWAHGMDDLSRDQKRPARGGPDAFLPFSASDVAQLSELNRFDLRLGGEVSRLHALDVASIEQLQRYYPAAVAPGPASDSCCATGHSSCGGGPGSGGGEGADGDGKSGGAIGGVAQ